MPASSEPAVGSGSGETSPLGSRERLPTILDLCQQARPACDVEKTTTLVRVALDEREERFDEIDAEGVRERHSESLCGLRRRGPAVSTIPDDERLQRISTFRACTKYGRAGVQRPTGRPTRN